MKLYGALFKYDDGPPAQGVFLTSSFNCRDPATGPGANNAICGALPAFPINLLGYNDELGTIETAKSADLVVLDGDPLRDLAALRAPRLVLVRGATAYRAPSGTTPLQL